MQSEEFTVPAGVVAELGRHVEPAVGIMDIWLKDSTCSRRQVRLTEQSDGRILIENLSTKVEIQESSGGTIAPKASITWACPFRITVGATSLDVTNNAQDPETSPMAEANYFTQSMLSLDGQINPTRRWMKGTAQPEIALSHDNLLDWFSALIAVQRSAAGSLDFYQEIADATVELIGLDYGLVLLRDDDSWTCTAAHGVDKRLATWSTTIVGKTVQERRTFYEPLSDLGQVQSLATMDAVVAAPILRVDDSVIGVIYGARRVQPGRSLLHQPADNGEGVSELQAQLVQLLAASAATGLARAEKEAEAVKLRGQFEDFCSPEVVRELYVNPTLLEPSSREVTVMFCDVRGFTRLCEQLSPAESNAVTTELLDGIAECILRAQGLIIDFYGDGVAAMWNAPCTQENHARLAIDCAMRIQQAMSLQSVQPENPKRQTLRVGIGIHTGMALVGNVGGSRRIKYGPRGNTVNLASRIEGVTKFLGVDVLISGETARKGRVLQSESRRLGLYQLAGTDNPVELFEFTGAISNCYSADQLAKFESAVAKFEMGKCQEAEILLSDYMASHQPTQTDSVADFLMNEIAKRSRNPGESHPSHIRLTEK